VIVSASRGQYLKPGSYEPGFFFVRNTDWRIKLPSLREAQQQKLFGYSLNRLQVALRNLSSDGTAPAIGAQ
jgi:hypothetical protein